MFMESDCCASAELRTQAYNNDNQMCYLLEAIRDTEAFTMAIG